MKKNRVFFYLIFIFFYSNTFSQKDIETEIKEDIDRSRVYISKDDYETAFKLLKENEKKLENTNFYLLKAKNFVSLGLAYQQIFIFYKSISLL